MFSCKIYIIKGKLNKAKSAQLTKQKYLMATKSWFTFFYVSDRNKDFKRNKNKSNINKSTTIFDITKLNNILINFIIKLHTKD